MTDSLPVLCSSLVTAETKVSVAADSVVALPIDCGTTDVAVTVASVVSLLSFVASFPTTVATVVQKLLVALAVSSSVVTVFSSVVVIKLLLTVATLLVGSTVVVPVCSVAKDVADDVPVASSVVSEPDSDIRVISDAPVAATSVTVILKAFPEVAEVTSFSIVSSDEHCPVLNTNFRLSISILLTHIM